MTKKRHRLAILAIVTLLLLATALHFFGYTQIAACVIFVNIGFLIIYSMFFKNYPPQNTRATRFRANHSKGLKGYGDIGETYQEWEAQDKKLKKHRKSKET